MTKTLGVAARQIARFERKAVILDRFHDELQAMAQSLRVERLLRANRVAVVAIQQRAETARTRLRTCAPTTQV